MVKVESCFLQLSISTSFTPISKREILNKVQKDIDYNYKINFHKSYSQTKAKNCGFFLVYNHTINFHKSYPLGVPN